MSAAPVLALPEGGQYTQQGSGGVVMWGRCQCWPLF
jgi:hypothetical protein